MNYKFIRKLLFLTIFYSACSTIPSEPSPGYKRIQELILSLENQPSIKRSRSKEVTEVLIWATKCNFQLYMGYPIEIDSTYQYSGELLIGFSYGSIYYAIDNFHSFSRENDIIREFNINVAIRGFEGMIKWYDGIIKVKGEAARLPILEDLKEEIKYSKIRTRAEKLVDSKIDKYGFKKIIIYI